MQEKWSLYSFVNWKSQGVLRQGMFFIIVTKLKDSVSTLHQGVGWTMFTNRQSGDRRWPSLPPAYWWPWEIHVTVWVSDFSPLKWEIRDDQLWILIGRTDAEAPVLWPCSAKSQPIGKDPDAGKDWRQEEKGVTEDEMAGWYHWLNGHESEQNLGDSEGQGSLVCCSPWGHKESDMT